MILYFVCIIWPVQPYEIMNNFRMASCIPSLFIRVLGAWIVLQYLALGVWGRITLESVKDLTAVTRECKGRIGGWGEVVGSGTGGEGGEVVIEGSSRGVEWEGGQLVLGGGGGDGDGDGDGIGDRDDIEDVSFCFLLLWIFRARGSWSLIGLRGWLL